MTTALMTFLEGGSEVTNHLPIPAWGFGLIGFACLMAGLFVVLGLGKSRPHS